MEENIDKLIQAAIDNLEENQTAIEAYGKRIRELNQEQVNKFLELVEKVKPIIDFLKKNKHSFYNRHFDCNSTVGPVIGREDNFMYMWANGIMVTKYDLFTKDTTNITVHDFLAKHSYKDAMQGLLEVLNAQNHIIRSYQNVIDNEESEISEVNELI